MPGAAGAGAKTETFGLDKGLVGKPHPLLYTTPICTIQHSSARSLVLHGFPYTEASVAPRLVERAHALVMSGGTPMALPSAAKKLLRAPLAVSRWMRTPQRLQQ